MYRNIFFSNYPNYHQIGITIRNYFVRIVASVGLWFEVFLRITVLEWKSKYESIILWFLFWFRHIAVKRMLIHRYNRIIIHYYFTKFSILRYTFLYFFLSLVVSFYTSLWIDFSAGFSRSSRFFRVLLSTFISNHLNFPNIFNHISFPYSFLRVRLNHLVIWAIITFVNFGRFVGYLYSNRQVWLCRWLIDECRSHPNSFCFIIFYYLSFCNIFS